MYGGRLCLQGAGAPLAEMAEEDPLLRAKRPWRRTWAKNMVISGMTFVIHGDWMGIYDDLWGWMMICDAVMGFGACFFFFFICVFLGNFRVEMKLGKGKVGSLFGFFV